MPAPHVLVPFTPMRARHDRWRDLARLVRRLESVVLAAARVDSLRLSKRRRSEYLSLAMKLDVMLDDLSDEIDAHVRDVTVDLLDADLARKKKRDR